MQEFREILETDTVSDSREYINKGLQTLRSNFAGEAFPTENLAVGMKCYRIDKGRTYTLKSLDPLLWEEDGSAVKREDMTNSQLFTEAMTREALKNITDWSHFFSKLPVMEYLDLSPYPIDNATKLEYLFANDFMLKSVTGLEIGAGKEGAQGWISSSVKSFEGMFYRCESLLEFNGEVINTRGVENLKEMFAYCRRLTKLSVGHWIMQQCKTMAGMFKGCEKLEEIDVSKWDVSNVEDFSSMFEGCNSLTARIWKTYDKPENQYFGISDLRAWVTTKAKNMGQMFKGCLKLGVLDLSKFDMRNVENAQGMFQDCYNLRNIVCGEHTFSTSKVKNFAHMFDSAFEGISGGGYSYYNQEPIRLLEKMDFSSATNMTAMLRNVSLYNEEVKIDKGDVDAFWVEFAHYIGDEKYCARGLSLRINASKLDDIMQMLEGYSQNGIYLEMDTSNITNMSRLFEHCSATCIRLKGFDTQRSIARWMSWQPKETGIAHMFQGCRSLRFLILDSQEFTFKLEHKDSYYTYTEDIFADLPAECRVLVPKALLPTYRAAPVWKDYAERIEAMEDYEFTGSSRMFVRRRRPTAEEYVRIQDTVTFRKV
jgi:surface protein